MEVLVLLLARRLNRNELCRWLCFFSFCLEVGGDAMSERVNE